MTDKQKRLFRILVLCGTERLFIPESSNWIWAEDGKTISFYMLPRDFVQKGKMKVPEEGMIIDVNGAHVLLDIFCVFTWNKKCSRAFCLAHIEAENILIFEMSFNGKKYKVSMQYIPKEKVQHRIRIEISEFEC